MEEFKDIEPQNGGDVEYEELLIPPKPRRERTMHDTPLDVEVVRVERDDFDHDITEPAPDEEQESDAAAASDGEEQQSVPKQRFKLIRQLILGTILNADSVRENYRYAIMIAVMLFLSIVMLFTSLDSYLRYTKLTDEVHLLREQAIRMSEQRYEHSSHSAIVRQLKQRGINLDDPSEPHEILE